MELKKIELAAPEPARWIETGPLGLGPWAVASGPRSLSAGVMPDKMTKIDWIIPWESVLGRVDNFNAGLQLEISVQHQMYSRHATAIGHRIDCDDVLFVLDDGTLAVVHLTWSGTQNDDQRYPWTTLYSSVEDFVERAMLPDSREYESMA